MRFVLAVTLVIVFLAGAQTAEAQGTFAGTVSPGATRYYSFTPSASGQLTATLSWDNQSSSLLMILVCGTDPVITFGVAAGSMDRTARLESGLIGLNRCLLGVSTSNIIAAFRLNLQQASGQLATPLSATLHGVLPAGGDAMDSRLIEQADRVFAALTAGAR